MGGGRGWPGKSWRCCIGYRPGCGPEPALMSARRTRPAVCNTPPRPLCSPAGSWPEERRWRRDLMDKAKQGYWEQGRACGRQRHRQPGRIPSQSLGGIRDKRPMLTLSLQTPQRAAPGLLCPSTAAESAVISLSSAGPRSTPTRPSCLSSLSRITFSASVCLSCRLPVSALGRRGRREGEKAGAPHGGVCTCAGHPGPRVSGNLDGGLWEDFHQVLQVTVTSLTPTLAPRRVLTW